MTQAAVLRLANLASEYTLTEDELTRIIRECRQRTPHSQPIALAAVEHWTRVIVETRGCRVA